MKNKVITSVIVIVMILSVAQAQRPISYQKGNKGQSTWRSDLSQDQKDQLKAKQTSYKMAIKSNKNQLNELMARKRTLETTDPVDAKALYKCLASINELKSEMQKQSIRHQQDVKSVLTDEQVLAFESKKGNGYKKGQSCDGPGQYQGNKKGNKRGRGHQYGQGSGKGQGQGTANGKRGGNKGQRKNGRFEKLNLTEDQMAFMEKSRLDFMKTQQGLMNQLNELSAKLKTSTTGKAVDLKNIDKIIDQQSKIKLQMAQKKADHIIEVREQLTDEQKLMLDTKHSRGRRMAMR